MQRVRHHVKLHYVLPPEERDGFATLPQVVRSSWRNKFGGYNQVDEVGESGEYTLELSKREARFAEARRNVDYVVPEQPVSKTSTREPECAHQAKSEAMAGAFPDPATVAYHYAQGLEVGDAPAKGVTYFHLDTGATPHAMNRITEAGGEVRVQNFTGGFVTDVSDRDGHGSMTLSLLAPPGARVFVYKVLGDDGNGSSVGIVEAIRSATQVAKSERAAGRREHYILSGSLGGGSDVFKPYVDACLAADAAGILCRFSAGNDGRHAVAAPGNWSQGMASIAFYRPTDRRAEFSNYSQFAGVASEGQQIIAIDGKGVLVRADGTSFSLPLWCRYTGLVCARTDEDPHTVHAAELSTGRDSGESIHEEGYGVLNVAATLAKLKPTVKPPATSYYPNLPRMTKTQFDRLKGEELDSAVLLYRYKEIGAFLMKPERA